MSLLHFAKFTFVTMICLVFSQASVLGQEEQPVLEYSQDDLTAANEQLQEELDKVDGLLYKATDENGTRIFTTAFELGGEVTKIKMYLRYLGKYAEKPVFGITMFTTAAESKTPFPPGVIKLVVVKADFTGVGGLSMSEGFDAVYVDAKLTGKLDAASLWMTFAYIHNNRIALKAKIEEIMATVDQ